MKRLNFFIVIVIVTTTFSCQKASLNSLAVSSATTKASLTSGYIYTVAGTGTRGYSGDGGVSTSAMLNWPASLTTGIYNTFISDMDNNRVRQINTGGVGPVLTGTISTYVGNGYSGFSGDGGLGTSANINLYASNNSGNAIASDANNDIFIADNTNHRIRKLNGSTGIITTIAGTGTPGESADGTIATSAQINSPISVAVDASGNVYFLVCYGTPGTLSSYGMIRYINASTGKIYTLSTPHLTIGYLSGLGSIMIDNYGTDNLYYWDYSASGSNQYSTIYTVPNIAANYSHPTISIVAGGPSLTVVQNNMQNVGDGGPATSAHIGFPGSMAMDFNRKNLYIASNGYSSVRVINLSTITRVFPTVSVAPGAIATIAGVWSGSSYVRGYTGDGGPSTNAEFNYINGLAYNNTQSMMYIADGQYSVMRGIYIP